MRKPDNSHQARAGLKAFFRYPALTLILVWSLFPVYWMLNNSFKNRVEQFSAVPTFFPHQITLENYRSLFSSLGFSNVIANSFTVSLTSTLIAVVIGSLAAYSLSRFKFRGKRILMIWILLTRIFLIITVRRSR